jgi:hypothetical protein
MNLSENIKKALINEIQIVREKMKGEENPSKKMFFYSGIYSEISRLFNREWNPQLQFMHMILNARAFFRIGF